MYDLFFHYDEQLTALEALTLDDVHEFQATLGKMAHVTMFIHGNKDIDAAALMTNSVCQKIFCTEASLQTPPPPLFVALRPSRSVALQPGISFIQPMLVPDPENVNSAIFTYYQVRVRREFSRGGKTHILSVKTILY